MNSAAAALKDVPELDLTVELITHRFTAGSKAVLEMDEAARSRKLTKFGSEKFVYPAEVMSDLRNFFTEALQVRLPAARVLYWT